MVFGEMNDLDHILFVYWCGKCKKYFVRHYGEAVCPKKHDLKHKATLDFARFLEHLLNGKTELEKIK